MKRLGLTQPQIIWELHVRQGRPLLEIAESLDLDLPTVSHDWRTLREQTAERAPRNDADWLTLRERISETLWRTVEMTFDTGTPREKETSSATASSKAKAKTKSTAASIEDEDEDDNAAAAPHAAAAESTAPFPPPPPSAPILSVRLKALDQLAKLYGLTLDPADTTTAPKPYATPEDIAEAVRLRVLELHGRRELAGGLGVGGG